MSGAKSFTDVLNGLTLDVTIIPGADAYWIKDAAGGDRLGGLVAEILNWVAKEANCTYNIFAIPGPVPLGYLTASGSADWTAWTLEHALRTDLLAQWTTDTYQRQALGLVWPFHHLDLKHVPIVRAIRHVEEQGLSLPFDNWPEFINGSTESVCVYGGSVRDSILSVLPSTRVREHVGASEAESHKWAVGELCSGGCAAYVQPHDRAENVLAEFNAGGSSSLRILEVPSSQRAGLASTRGGFATVLPSAREQEARQVSGDPNASAGGGGCTDQSIAAFRHILAKSMHTGLEPHASRPETALLLTRFCLNTVHAEAYSEFQKTRRSKGSGCSTCLESPPPSPPPPSLPPTPPPPNLPPTLVMFGEDTLWIVVWTSIATVGLLLLVVITFVSLRRVYPMWLDSAKAKKWKQFQEKHKERQEKVKQERIAKKEDLHGATNFLPLIYELNCKTEYNLQEGEEAMRVAMRVGGYANRCADKICQRLTGKGGCKRARELLTKHINEVQAELVKVRDTRTGEESSGKEIVAQCQQEIEKGGMSAAVYQAVFISIEGTERKGMKKYQDFCCSRLLLQQAEPRCEQNTTDLAELYEQALSIRDEAFRVMNVLRSSETFKGSADSWRLERGALKKLRYATRPNTNTPPLLTTVSCVWPQPCK